MAPSLASRLLVMSAALVMHHLALAGVSCDPAPHSLGSALALQHRIDAAMPRLLERHRVPGAAVALVQGGEAGWNRGYGWAIPAQQIPVSATTLFQAASDSKPVAAFTVLSLAQQGLLELDRSTEAQLPSGGESWTLPLSSFDKHGVTVARVLSHTAGLSVPGYGGFPPGTPAQSLIESLEGAADANDKPLTLVEPPGTAFRYSGGGYSLLQLLIDARAGEPFAEAAAQRILRPLGMTHSRFPSMPAPSPPLAATFDDQGRQSRARHFTALAAAGLETTASDLARLLTLLMPGPCGEQPGRGLLRPELIERMLTPMPHSANDLVFEGSRYGLGLALFDLPSGQRLAYHPGDNLPNWHNLIAALPARRAGLVVMTNAAGGRTLREDLLCLWLEALHEPLPVDCLKDAARGPAWNRAW